MTSGKQLFGIYEKAIKPQEWAAMFGDAKKAGYDSFELSLDASEKRLARLDWSRSKVSRVYHAACQSDIRLMTACLSAHRVYPLGSSDHNIQNRALGIMQKAIDLCVNLGIRILQVVAFDAYEEPSTELTRKRFVANLEKCVIMAEKACVMLAIEPVEVNLLAVKDTMKVIKGIASPWLTIYPDVANINSLGIDPISELTFGAGEISAIHIRESLLNDFHATVPFGTGSLDFKGVFQTLDAIEFNGPVTVEMWNENNPDYFKTIADAYHYIESCTKNVRQICK